MKKKTTKHLPLVEIKLLKVKVKIGFNVSQHDVRCLEVEKPEIVVKYMTWVILSIKVFQTKRLKVNCWRSLGCLSEFVYPGFIIIRYYHQCYHSEVLVWLHYGIVKNKGGKDTNLEILHILR